jgi:hypothetical protein
MLKEALTAVLLLAFCAPANAQYTWIFGVPAVPVVFSEPLTYVGTDTVAGHTYCTFQTKGGALFRGEIVNMQYVARVHAPQPAQVIPQPTTQPGLPAQVTP